MYFNDNFTFARMFIKQEGTGSRSVKNTKIPLQYPRSRMAAEFGKLVLILRPHPLHETRELHEAGPFQDWHRIRLCLQRKATLTRHPQSSIKRTRKRTLRTGWEWHGWMYCICHQYCGSGPIWTGSGAALVKCNFQFNLCAYKVMYRKYFT